jgi:LPPG:FO 2-phospho-L-lactate transferase
MLAGLAAVLGQPSIAAVINTGDDTVLHGLHVSPDIDTVTYTLAGVSNREMGWGLAGETWTVMEALGSFDGVAGRSLTWFSLGDKDLATHLYRTGRLAEGATLSQVTADVAQRFGVGAQLLPMSDDRVETRVTLRDGHEAHGHEAHGHEAHGHEAHGHEAQTKGQPARMPAGSPAGAVVSFQEYFVGLAHAVPVAAVDFAGIEAARPAPGVIEAVETADLLVICPSNPVVSIGPVLGVPGVAQAVTRRRETTVAVSPIIAGRALKGPADHMLAELGYEPTAAGVAEMWAPYAATIVIDNADAALAGRIETLGVRCVVAPSVMSGPAEAAKLAEAVLGVAP